MADDQLNPDVAKQNADRLLKRDRVDFVTGTVFSNVVLAIAPQVIESKTFFIGPNEYGFDRGVEILTMAILGGINGLAGPVLGAVILTLLPEVLRGFADYRLVVNGIILVLIVLFLPKGLWDPVRMRRWFSRRP